MFLLKTKKMSYIEKIKKIVLLLVLWAATTFATPVVLKENINRNTDKDSVFTLRFKNDSEFWLANNFTFRLKIIGGTINNGRIIAYIGDSIGYKSIDFVVGGFFDNRAVYAKTIDWLKPETAKNHDGKPLKAADLYRLMLRYASPQGNIVIGVGKDYYNWGPSQLGGLMVSDYNMGFTGLYQQYKLWGFTIRGISAQLNSTPWGHENVYSAEQVLTHRFFSAGRIEYYRDLWGIAVSQSMIYAGNGRSFELPYLIPVFPYHYVQISNWRYGNNGENSAGGLDAYANFFNKKLQIYGELFVDDFQGDRDDASQSVQNALGFIAGAKFDIPKIIYGFAEAGQINSFVYNHTSGEALRYVNKNAFIGSPLGPDNQLFWGKLGYDFNKINLKTEIYGWFLRQGERDIIYEYTGLGGTRKDKIPFGKVRREATTWLSAIYEYRYNTVEIYGGISKIQTENVSRTSGFIPFGGFKINGAIRIGWDKK